jgi:hypothetical protein
MPNHVNNRSQTYSIAHAMQRCAGCARRTPVVGLILPPGHETLEVGADEEAAAADAWGAAEAGAFLFFIEHLSEAVRNRLRQHSQHYRLDHDEQAGQIYWMNHCSFCGARQEDFELYCEPEGAFLPISEHAAASIRLQQVSEPFEAQAAGYAYAPDFFDGVER